MFVFGCVFGVCGSCVGMVWLACCGCVWCVYVDVWLTMLLVVVVVGCDASVLLWLVFGAGGVVFVWCGVSVWYVVGWVDLCVVC